MTLKQVYLLILLLFSFQLTAQEISIKGKVTDSLQNPLPFANIMAESMHVQAAPIFAMTDEKGYYHLALLKKHTYQISVLYMGYQPMRFKIDSLSSSVIKNIVLKQQQNQLDEVVITADMPVKIQEDTITYKTDRFKTGDERKLKDVLKKLPGIEVAKSGKITIMGKKVTSVLVEGKTFFGGGTKLAIDNIPADAVDKVIAIDDYNDISFMKGLTDEQKMIINIKLKKGKKRFVFGDVVSGVGNNQHYLAKANLFYYSPKTNLSYIGNLNNVGESPMTLDDFIRFESSLMDMSKLKSSFQSFKDISSVITPGNFLNKNDNFHAIQWQQDFSQKIEWNTYAIYANNETNFKQIDNRTYLFNNETENREIIKIQDHLSGLSKMHFRYKKNFINYFDFDIYLKKIKTNSTNNINSITKQNNNYILDQKKDLAFSLKTYLGWHHQLNKHHTIRWQNTFNIIKNSPNENWKTNQSAFNSLLPLQHNNFYSVMQYLDKENYEWNTELKHYWIHNNKQHIYFILGNHWSKQNFISNSWQELYSGGVNSFQSAGFNNDLKLHLDDAFGGMQYKIKLWESIFKFSLFAHQITWKLYGNDAFSDSYFYFSPEFSLEKKIKYTRKISFKYTLKDNIFSVSKYANRYYLTGYNTVAKGNQLVRKEIMHKFLFTFRDFSIVNDYQYYINLSYQQKIDPVSHKIVYENTQSFTMPIILQTPSHSFNANLYLKRDYKNIYIKLLPVFRYSVYQQSIQDNLQDIKFFSQQYKFVIGSYFKKYPNFDFGSNFRWNKYSVNKAINTSKSISPFIEINYDFLKSFVFKFNYDYHINYDYQNKRNIYQSGNFSLLYQKENHPWGFEILANNIFNNSFINIYNQSNILLIDSYVFIQPRIIMFKLHYKL